MQKEDANLVDKIGTFIKGCRKRRGMSRNALYVITGISARTIMRIENGATNAKVNDLSALAAAVGVTLRDILSGIEINLACRQEILTEDTKTSTDKPKKPNTSTDKRDGDKK